MNPTTIQFTSERHVQYTKTNRRDFEAIEKVSTKGGDIICSEETQISTDLKISKHVVGNKWKKIFESNRFVAAGTPSSRKWWHSWWFVLAYLVSELKLLTMFTYKTTLSSQVSMWALVCPLMCPQRSLMSDFSSPFPLFNRWTFVLGPFFNLGGNNWIFNSRISLKSLVWHSGIAYRP